MIRGKTLIARYSSILADGSYTNDKHRVVAGGQWCTGPVQHIAIVGPLDWSVDSLKKEIDALTDEQWLCAHTLASDGWDGTPEDLIIAAKELTQ